MKTICNPTLKIFPDLFKSALTSWKVLVLLLSLIANSASAQDQPPIGETIIAIGDVKAINSMKIERALKRGDPFQVMEKIVVGAASKTQLKFSDGGIINLIASTEYMVDSYVFNNPDQKSHSLSSLAKGGFRAISGTIAKENVTGTLIRTPIATIGLRGTIYEALLANGKLFVGCEEGKLVVSNAIGKLEIGPSAPTLYAIVSAGEAPLPSTQKPAELAAVSFDVEEGLSIEAQKAVQQPAGTPAAQPAAANAMPFKEGIIDVQPSGLTTATPLQLENSASIRAQPSERESFTEGVFDIGPSGGSTTVTQVRENVEIGAQPLERAVSADYSNIDLNEMPYEWVEEGSAYEGSMRATYLVPALAIGALTIVGVIVVIYQNTSEHHHSRSHSSSRSPGSCYCH